MSVVPGDLETDNQPPMTIPLRHFLVGLGFLGAGCLFGLGAVLGMPWARNTLAHVHLLLAGWVCVTIMGAMTQFVPVWSGVSLHDRRLATWQLWLVAIGLAGFAAALTTGSLALTPVFGAVMLAGFWVFIYNVGRTLAQVESLDETERHFALALGLFLLVTVLGLGLAIDFVVPVFSPMGIPRLRVVSAHATLAVFGVILLPILGALYQLATMFTQTDLHGIDLPLRRVEEIGYPVGVLALAAGRLFGVSALGQIGGLLVLVGLGSMSLILARRLLETRVPRTPMLRRYGVAAVAMAGWTLLALPAWSREPVSLLTRFGRPGTVHLLTIGVIGFVVLGTLYHIVPFIVWVHQYSARLGYEDVPMIDDLYDDRLATADLALLVGGTVLLVAADLAIIPRIGAAIGGGLVLGGTLVFVVNLILVVRRHSPHDLGEILLPVVAGRRSGPDPAGVDES